MRSRRRVPAAILCLLTVGALSAAITAPSAGAAPATPPTGMLTEAAIRARMLTIPEITRASRTKGPVTTDGVTCHYAPYINNGNVRYCYYETLRSDAAYAAKQFSVTHVDVLSFDSPSLGRAYLKEMGNVGSPSARTVAKSRTSVTRLDTAVDVPVGTSADGMPITKSGAAVSVNVWTGSNFVYATCANPNGSVKGLRACADRLVAAQVKKLNK